MWCKLDAKCFCVDFLILLYHCMVGRFSGTEHWPVVEDKLSLSQPLDLSGLKENRKAAPCISSMTMLRTGENMHGGVGLA